MSAELVPIAEMRDSKPELQENDAVVVCKKGPLFAREGTVVKVLGNRVEVRVNNMNVAFKMTEIALPPKNGARMLQSEESSQPKGRSSARAVERALEEEKRTSGNARRNEDLDMVGSAFASQPSVASTVDVAIRTQSNTVDVRGCTLMEAQEKIKDKCSAILMDGRQKNPVIFILHGHGTGGVLKSKIRQWLKTESRSLVKKWSPADSADGGDAFTRIELK